ncbi:hypothetical protein [Pedobacter sp. Hv1]|uniref:hypothetical protein n=1 Tax=Pedobacter sp. Hv1 TaxID=1740090 RepID=UPI0006D8C488|nr:hypothetical protein [Pedobacter sp. Hv1]KQC02116.1 hypothetical protein AQF98_00645 [Pedobacter sp. Hv1]
MESFEIELLGKVITVRPLDSEDYEVFEDGQYLGVITPILGDNGITWSTHSEKIANDYAQQIGELIEEHDM